MAVEWVDNEHDSRARFECGVVLTVLTDVGRADWYSYPVSTVSGRGPHPTREAAKSAAEAEARRVLMRGLRELGWPDDAAVERACDCWNKATSTFMPDDADYVAEMRSDMRAALTAAMGGE